MPYPGGHRAAFNWHCGAALANRKQLLGANYINNIKAATIIIPVIIALPIPWQLTVLS
jgi:hypothetical protein